MSITKAQAEMTDEQRRIRRLELRQDVTDAKLDFQSALIRAASGGESEYWSALSPKPYQSEHALERAVVDTERALEAWDRGEKV